MRLLITLTIWLIIYNELLPTISGLFEYIRSWIVYGITAIQYKTAMLQEEVEEIQERNTPRQTHAIGFQLPVEEEDEEYV